MRSAVLWHFGEFEQYIARRLWVEKSDAAIAVADHRRLVQKRRALRLKFSERGIDVFDLEADVVEALALFGQPLRGIRLRRRRLEQFDIALADRQHRQP